MTPSEQEAALRRVLAELDAVKARRERTRPELGQVEASRREALLSAGDAVAQRDRLRAALVPLLDDRPCAEFNPRCADCVARAALEETK